MQRIRDPQGRIDTTRLQVVAGTERTWMIDHSPGAWTPAPGVGDLFQMLRDGSLWTRGELVRATGMTRAMVVARLEPLLANGFLTPAGEASSSGGRPATRFGFNRRARLAVGVDLGVTRGRIAITDLAANVLASTMLEMRIDAGPVPVLDGVIDTVRELAGEESPERFVGIGIGLPGPVAHPSGIPTHPPIMPGWDGFDVPSYLTQRLGMPAWADNDVNVLALGEHAIAWRDVADLLYVKVSTGIGLGAIARHRLLRGAQGAAGDLGHVRVAAAEGTLYPEGPPRDLEEVAGAHAISEWVRAHNVPLPDDDIDHAIRSGNPVAVDAARRAGRLVGAALATCVNILNPSMILLGGRISAASDDLLAGVREVVYRDSLLLATQNLRVQHATVGEHTGARGAALLAIDEALSPRGIERLLK